MSLENRNDIAANLRHGLKRQQAGTATEFDALAPLLHRAFKGKS